MKSELEGLRHSLSATRCRLETIARPSTEPARLPMIPSAAASMRSMKVI